MTLFYIAISVISGLAAFGLLALFVWIFGTKGNYKNDGTEV